MKVWRKERKEGGKETCEGGGGRGNVSEHAIVVVRELQRKWNKRVLILAYQCLIIFLHLLVKL